jgi:hypothetical protein
MRAPNESLDDFINKAARRKTAEPPPLKSVHLTGEVEIVKPLATSYDFAKRKADGASLRTGRHRLSWFHRSLAVAGSFALIALILGTGIFIRLYGPPAKLAENHTDTVAGPSDVATNEQPERLQVPDEEQTSSDLLPESNSPFAFSGPSPARSVAHRRSVARRPKPRLLLAVYRPRHFAPRPQFVVSSFFPTTLDIYIENGEIKTRIEPWLTAAYKSSLPN